jgi:hypothetical protein
MQCVTKHTNYILRDEHFWEDPYSIMELNTTGDISWPNNSSTKKNIFSTINICQQQRFAAVDYMMTWVSITIPVSQVPQIEFVVESGEVEDDQDICFEIHKDSRKQCSSYTSFSRVLRTPNLSRTMSNITNANPLLVVLQHQSLSESAL